MHTDVIFDRRMTKRQHIEKRVAKSIRTYIRTYSLLNVFSTNIKFTFYTVLTHLGICGGQSPLETLIITAIENTDAKFN
jgi:hypothetical protein